MSVKLLDCTLRDGGHINDSYFGKNVISGVVQKLYSSQVDYLEVGFLRTDMDSDSEDIAIFRSIEAAEKKIPVFCGKTKLVLMAQEDQYDINQLSECRQDSRFKIIRVSFHDFDMKEGLNFCRALKRKGYQCCINPINLSGYSDHKLLELIDIVNDIAPFAFTIVDTFGSLRKGDLSRIYQIIEHNLASNITIGLHLHENLSLSFSLAQAFVDMKSSKRDVIIDGSLYGMGRVPGNLCIELMMDYMNTNYGSIYKISEALEAIDEYILSIRKNHPWGYSIVYSLSAQHKVHRTYAEYLMQKGKLNIADIDRILEKIDGKKATRFSKDYIEHLYIEYMDVPVKEDIRALLSRLHNKTISVFAPGKNLQKYLDKENECREDDISICLNFIDKEVQADFYFYTNQKRWEKDLFKINLDKVIISSNIRTSNTERIKVISYGESTLHYGIHSDSSLLMLLALLKRCKCKKLNLIGFDGFNTDNDPFYEKGFDRIQNYEIDTKEIKDILPLYRKDIQIEFLTISEYEDF